MIGTTLIQGEMVCPQIIVDNLCPHCDPILYKPRHSILNSCVFFWILKSKRVKFEGGSFEQIEFFSQIFFTGSLSRGGPETVDLSTQP